MATPTVPSLFDRRFLQRAFLTTVHPRRSRGNVCTARATPGVGRGWDEGLVAPSSKALSAQIEQADIQYAGMNRFTGRRHSRNVTGIGCGFQDLDFYKPGLPHASATAEEVVSMAIEAYDKAGIPRPSLGEDSGRGAYTMWLFIQGMSGKALPRWQAALRNLRGPKLDADGNVPKRRGKAAENVDPKVLALEKRMLPVWRMNAALGLDRSAIDPARVLRVMGTIHPANGRMARLAWPSTFQDIERVDFDAWCDALMPYTRAEMRALRAERAAWKAANPDHVKVERSTRRRPAGGKWALILADLMRLLEHRGADEFARLKMRDLWTMLAATAISVTEGGCASDWAERLAPMIGLPVHEVEVSLSGVERGMHSHEAGETRDWKGAIRPAFYDYAYSAIVDMLDIGIEEADEAGLRVLVPGGAIPLTPAERQRLSRDSRNPGRNTRSNQVEARAQDGHVALGAKACDYSIAEIAYATGRGEESLRQAMREAEAELAARSSIPDDRAETVSTPHDVSRSIVVVDPIPAPASLPAPAEAQAIPEGEVRTKRLSAYLSIHRTATACWSTFRRHDYSRWVEDREDLTLKDWDDAHRYRPATTSYTASQEALYAAVMSRMAIDDARERRLLGRGRTRPVTVRPAARPVASRAPLDVAHEARLYLAATRGS